MHFSFCSKRIYEADNGHFDYSLCNAYPIKPYFLASAQLLRFHKKKFRRARSKPLCVK